MNNKKARIWGRDFELRIVYQNFPGEDVTLAQEKSTASIDETDYCSALDMVKQYIKKWNADELREDTDISNIFRYVIPKSFLIPRKDDKATFAVMCNYKFDMEHGIAVLFENGKCKEVGPQDLVL